MSAARLAKPVLAARREARAAQDRDRRMRRAVRRLASILGAKSDTDARTVARQRFADGLEAVIECRATGTDDATATIQLTHLRLSTAEQICRLIAAQHPRGSQT